MIGRKLLKEWFCFLWPRREPPIWGKAQKMKTTRLKKSSLGRNLLKESLCFGPDGFGAHLEELDVARKL